MSTPPDGTALKVGITPSRPKLNPREHFGSSRKLRSVGLGLPAKGDRLLRSHKMCHFFAGLRLPHPIFAFRSQSIGYKIHERSAMSRPTHSCEAGDRAREGGGRGRPCVRDEGKNPTGERRRRRRIDSSSAVFNSFPLLTPTRFIAETTQRERERAE